MSHPENDAVLPVSVVLKPFLATNGNWVSLQAIKGDVLSYQLRRQRKKRDRGWVEKIDYEIWLLLADGHEECLRLRKSPGDLQPGHSLTLLMGSNADRNECVALYNRSNGQVFYCSDVWGKLLDAGCLLPVLFLLFVFPLIWLFLAMIAFKFSLKAVLVIFLSPVIAASISVALYLGLTWPVQRLFRRHLSQLLSLLVD